MKSFNYSHPELKDGEMFLCNVSSDSYKDELGLTWQDSEPCIARALSNMSSFKFPSKRLGKVAYDSNGNILKNTCPVFINESDYNRK